MILKSKECFTFLNGIFGILLKESFNICYRVSMNIRRNAAQLDGQNLEMKTHPFPFYGDNQVSEKYHLHSV
jgi:hypothetical protein